MPYVPPASSGGGVSDGDKGDITVSASGATWTIDAGVVTNAKSANMTTKTYKGRTAGTTGAPEDVAVATLKTDLALVKADVALGNVDNTTDAGKPVSTAQQTAIDAKVADAINNNTTTIAPSQNAVFDALALKADDSAAVKLTGTQTIAGAKTFSTPIAPASVQTMSASVGGGVPTPPNNTTTFLRGDGTFAAPSSGFADPLTTNGDIIARISASTTRLAQGSNGTFLGVSGGTLGYYTPAGGGDVAGPASATNNAIARYDTTTGKLIQDSNVQITDLGSLSLPLVANPVVADADRINLFGRKVGGRMFPSFMSPSGLDSALQPLMARNKIGYWNPPGNATTVPGVFGFTAPTVVGTATSRSVATTNGATRMRRLGYVSVAGAGGIAEARVAVAQFSGGSGADDGSGFFYLTRFVPSNAASVSGERFFIGLRNVTVAGTNVQPNTFTQTIGLAQLSTDSTQFYIVYGGSTAQTAIACGTALGAPTTLSTAAFELAIFSPNSLVRTYYVQVTNIFTGETFNTTLNGTTVQVPSETTLLSHRAFKTNNATALAVAFDICSIYIETDT